MDFLNTLPNTEFAAFVAPNATIIGNVVLKQDSSIWFGAVLRADNDCICVGERSNVQDNAVLHCDPNQPCIIGNDCVIGHGAIVHGATIENGVLIGMHATILNGAVVGSGSIVGANALVTENMVIPPNSLVLGVPAKIVKQIDKLNDILLNADVYVKKAKLFRNKYT